MFPCATPASDSAIPPSSDFSQTAPAGSIGATLREIGVPDALACQLPELPRDVQAILVYGSQARGDAVDGSDLDLLALVSSPRPSLTVGDVSLSFYTRNQLKTGIGTLFGSHLRRDSRVLWDPHGHLAGLVAEMGDVDTDRLLRRAINMSALFTTPHRDLPKYRSGLLRHARYLLRSCLYAQAIAFGQSCFSVREIARRQGDSELITLLASRQQAVPTLADLEECLRRLAELTGDFPDSKHGSLEATIVNEWGQPSDLLSAAFLALGSTGAGSMYAEVEKILL